MMHQINKIYIENFKGVEAPSIVDFEDNQLTILSGPNGFGKTTIFDAIELCLRGHLNRTMSYIHVTKKTSGHKKPFYQNTSGKDVILKLWIKEGGKDHIIVKRLEKDSPGTRSNTKLFRPDAWDLIDTYYSSNASDFVNTLNFDTLSKVEQDFVDRLFFGENGFSMENLYPLFNYLQQEDNIYFLKKDEDTKKHELSFLFQTQKEDEELEKISAISDLLISVRLGLQGRINDLNVVTIQSSGHLYNQLFSSENFPFDLEDPFKGTTDDQLKIQYEGIKEVLNELLSFTRNFSPDEFEKKRYKDQLSAVSDNNALLETLVSSYIIEESRFNLLKETVGNNEKLRQYLISLKNYSVDRKVLSGLEFPNDFIEDFENQLKRRSELYSKIGEVGKIILELNSVREETIEKFKELHSLHQQEANCPLCNTPFESLENLFGSFTVKTTILMEYNRKQQEEVLAIEESIKANYIDPIIANIEEFLSLEANVVDLDFYKIISERRGSLDAINRFKNILELKQIQLTPYLLEEAVTLKKFHENVNELRLFLKSLIDNIVIDENRLTRSNLYSQYFQENKDSLLTEADVLGKIAYVDEKYNVTCRYSLNILTDRLMKITALESNVKKIKDNLSASIKAYKKEMIEKIKIPFYIYSGKILQHYQQGYGIFVDVKDSTNRVRFLTGETTDHDIIHQLSSGQLAVVSIAFCLALNKVYQSPQHFKFLAIDDPVQTLDDLNIHSFIELVRHEFNDYKLIISTHEEHIANYLLYKFEKFKFSNKKLNVQKNFYKDN